MADETNVVLTANTQPYERSVDQATSTTNKMLSAVSALTIAIDGAFKSAGRTMQIGGAGMVASITAMGFAAGRLDQQMSHLQASMTMVAKSQADYQARMKDYGTTVTNLRSTFGMTSQEAINLSSQLNKLGQSSRNVNALSDSFVRLSAISGEGVAGLTQSMIQLQRQMGTEGVTQTKVFNATLAQLSQSAGASATSILQFSQAIAPVAKLSGMTQKEIMGVSTAFVKSGADGFAAANAFNKMLTDITRSIQYGSPELKAYANLIGVSVEQFKELPRTEAITRIFEQINKQGPQAIKTLERFGLDGVRTMKSIQAVANTGGIRSAVAAAMGGSDQGKFNEASNRAFDGLNDQMKKMGENAKMIAEAFGQGVLPIMNSVAKAVNSILSPLNQVLQSLGKLPGGTMLLSGLALGAAGAIVRNFTGLSTLSLATGAYRTARGGWRAGANPLGPPPEELSGRERAAYFAHQDRLLGYASPGNFVQHGIYGAMGQARGFADRGGVGGTAGGMFSTVRSGISSGLRGLINLGGNVLVSGLAPTSSQAWRNNFNRDPSLQMFRSSSAADAFGWPKVAAFGSGLKEGFGVPGGPSLKTTAEAASKATTSINNATDHTKKYGSVMGTLNGNVLKLSSAMGQSALTTAKMAGIGAWRGLGMIAPPAGRGLMSMGRGALDLVGGPGGAALMGGIGAATWAYGQHTAGREAELNMMRSPDNTSPGATYAAALGLASMATKTFAQVVLEQSAVIKSQGFNANKPTQETLDAVAKTRNEFTYEQLKTATPSQVKTIIEAVKSTNPSESVMGALQADLLRLYGTDKSGQARTAAALAGAGNNLQSMTGFYNMASDAQKGWSPANMFRLTDESIAAAQSGGSQIGQLMAQGPASRGNQTGLASLNQLVMNAPGKPGFLKNALFGNSFVAGAGDAQAIRAKALTYVKGILGPGGENDTASIDAVTNAIRENGNDPKAVQEALINSNTDIGRNVKQMVQGLPAGVDRYTTKLPSTAWYQSSFANAGVSSNVMAQMIGQGPNTGTPSSSIEPRYIGGKNALTERVFSGTGGVSLAVNKAINAEGDVGAQWTGMKALGDMSIRLSGGFAGAVQAIDQLKAAAGDASSPLYQLALAARNYVRERQSVAMGYMSDSGVARELSANYAADVATDINDNTQESGQNRAQSQAALEQFILQTKDRLRSYAMQVREFNVQRRRGEEDFALQQRYSLEDYNRQRKYAYEDFNISRRRAEEDFNHQVVVMAKQTAKTMTNVYERMNVERTWSAQNLLQNMADQQARLNEQQGNLRKLRGAGLSGTAIEMMGLNDPSKMQQLARLTEDMLSDPKLIEAMNNAAKKRNATAEKIVKDPNSLQWQEMQYSFRKSMARGEADFKRGMDRQTKQFEISMDRMTDAYKRGLDRASEDLNRSMESITNDFEDLAEAALKTLTGTSKKQMQKLLADLGYVSGQVMRMTGSTIDQVNALFAGLGISPGGSLTTPNGGRLMTGTITVNGQRYNAGLFGEGGEIPGYSPHKKADNIPLYGTAGEFMQPVDSVQYYGKEFMEKLRARQIPKDAVQHLASGGMVYQQMADWVHQNLPGVAITSSYRPGAITALGNVSMHAKGKALDLAPSMGTFNKILSAFGSKIYQLFYSPADGRTILRGKPWHMDRVTKGDHWDHVHWAMNSMMGGVGGGAPGGWDGEYASLLKMVQALSGIKKFNTLMNKSDIGALNYTGHDRLAKYVSMRGYMLGNQGPGIDQDFTGKWNGDGALFKKATQIGVGERGPEAVLPLNQRGVDFLFEVMKKNSSDSKRALVAAGGVPTQASTVSYYSRVDKSTIISGDITVKANDPDEFLRKIEAKKKMEALKGRH